MKRGMLAALAGLAMIGCGDGEEPAPAACLGGADVYIEALRTAPDEVRLDGMTPISDCLIESQSGGDLGQVGEGMIGAATELNRLARQDPGGDATVELGYLVGAVQEGASTTGGIHEDLVIRLDAAARFAGEDGPFPPAFERAFGAGYAAGQDTG